MERSCILQVLTLIVVLARTADAFVVLPQQHQHQPYVRSTSKLYASSSPSEQQQQQSERIDVVLFGIGDLRVDDHGGLQAALMLNEGRNSKILPLVVLDPTAALASKSMMTSHAMDTAAMIVGAVSDLQTSLLQDFQLELQVSSAGTSIEETLRQLQTLPFTGDVHIHVCDVDKIDNELGYGPYSSLVASKVPNVHAWTCHLREEPWRMGTNCDLYTEYQNKYQKTTMIQPPIDTPRQVVPEERRIMPEALTEIAMSSTIPTSEEFLESILQATISGDDMNTKQQRCLEEQGTGLFGTHWGGLPAESIGETKVWQTVQDYCLSCQEDDNVWAQHVNYIGKQYQRKASSLEHASMEWMSKDSSPNQNNWLAGESMTRYLAAPLLLGTISPRRLAQVAAPPSLGFHTSAIQRLVEGREWHKLLACHNMNNNDNDDDDSLEYSYWRWHGFLCRYAKKQLTAENKAKKDALLLVHGFGASSAQWQRSIDALSDEQASSSSLFDQVLAPDLIGFGQCEKPALTYTQYLWSGFVNDFAKEIGIGQESWNSFVVGGNSIGGYTSMTVAADDSVQLGSGNVLSSMGAPGSNRCSGLTLFNSAGNIQTKEEIVALQQEMSDDKAKFRTVAQLTATDGLPPCSPPPRPVARLFGNALLTYLRPNIGPICKKVYPVNPDAADEDLAQNILRDSLDPGAVNVMISGSKLPIPRTANELLGSDFGSALDMTAAVKEGIFKGPVLVAQGMLDPLNDAKGRASMLSDLRDGITVSPINGGHCPHDEMPQECMRALLQWTEQQRAAVAVSPAVTAATLSK